MIEKFEMSRARYLERCEINKAFIDVSLKTKLVKKHNISQYFFESSMQKRDTRFIVKNIARDLENGCFKLDDLGTDGLGIDEKFVYFTPRFTFLKFLRSYSKEDVQIAYDEIENVFAYWGEKLASYTIDELRGIGEENKLTPKWIMIAKSWVYTNHLNEAVKDIMGVFKKNINIICCNDAKPKIDYLICSDLLLIAINNSLCKFSSDFEKPLLDIKHSKSEWWL